MYMGMNKPLFEKLKQIGFVPTDHNLIGFAEACYNMNVVEDCIDCMTATPDKTTVNDWNINPNQWRTAQKQALETAMYDFENSLKG